MLTNLKCHLQFLERYLCCTLCHAAGTLAVAEPVLGGRGGDGERHTFSAAFEDQILFLARARVRDLPSARSPLLFIGLICTPAISAEEEDKV